MPSLSSLTNAFAFLDPTTNTSLVLVQGVNLPQNQDVTIVSGNNSWSSAASGGGEQLRDPSGNNTWVIYQVVPANTNKKEHHHHHDRPNPFVLSEINVTVSIAPPGMAPPPPMIWTQFATSPMPTVFGL